MKILADNGVVQIRAPDGDSTEHTLVVTGDNKALAKRAHDITGAIAGLKFIVKAVKARYEFSEEEALPLGESAEKALAALELEATFLLKFYNKRA